MCIGRLNEQNTLPKVQHDRILDDRQYRAIDCLDSSHRVIVNLDVSLDSCMVVLTLAQYTILFILLNLVESDQSITTLIFDSFCEDAVLIVAAKCVHQDMGLCRGHMHSATAAFDFAALDLGVITFGYFDAWTEHTLDDDSLDDLFGTLTLKVNAHHFAIRDLTILNLNRVVWVGQTVYPSSLKVIESRI